jgi:pimeloyl-ACP methyl ester carboxylesterase
MPLPTLLILPGLLEDADAFDALVSGTQDIATAFFADMTRADSIAGLATEALKQAPEGPFLLAGHSMGGYVALEILRQAPARVAKLALLNTNARPDTPESTENRRRLMALADRDFEGVINALMPKVMSAEHQKDPVMSGIVAAMALGIGKDAFKRQQEAIINRIDSRPHLAAIRCPTRVVAARDDAIMPVELLEELAKGIRGARLDVVEDSGHMASIEQPEEVVRIVRDWIQGGSP